MNSSQLRAQARKSLTGKWGKAALLTLCYSLLTSIISIVLSLIPFIGRIASIVISIPLSYGFIVSFIKLKRDQEISYVGFFEDGFSAFSKIWGVVGHTILKLIIPIVLIIVSIFILSFSTVGLGFSAIATNSTKGIAGFGIVAIIGLILYIASLVYAIVKGYLYSLTFYINYDNPEMSSKEIVEKSEELMNGYRGKYFCLGLSFIGWLLLSPFTLYIGVFWLIPYIQVAMICFYENRSGILNENSEEKSE